MDIHKTQLPTLLMPPNSKGSPPFFCFFRKLQTNKRIRFHYEKPEEPEEPNHTIRKGINAKNLKIILLIHEHEPAFENTKNAQQSLSSRSVECEPRVLPIGSFVWIGRADGLLSFLLFIPSFAEEYPILDGLEIVLDHLVVRKTRSQFVEAMKTDEIDALKVWCSS